MRDPNPRDRGPLHLKPQNLRVVHEVGVLEARILKRSTKTQHQAPRRGSPGKPVTWELDVINQDEGAQWPEQPRDLLFLLVRIQHILGKREARKAPLVTTRQIL